jgi:hypothetical protein
MVHWLLQGPCRCSFVALQVVLDLRPYGTSPVPLLVPVEDINLAG